MTSPWYFTTEALFILVLKSMLQKQTNNYAMQIIIIVVN